MVPEFSSRLETLLARQNSDGGWGYFPGKQSWLEPSVYALLAARGHAPKPALDRAWQFLASCQRADGAWRPGPAVDHASWVTALAVLALASEGRLDQPLRRGIHWLLQSEGALLPWITRFVARFQPLALEQNHELRGWPYFPGSTSWVEPTALTLLALKSVRKQHPSRTLERRVEIGEQLLLDRRCRDGGWNYGNRRVLGHDMESFPDMTALALIGLQGKIPASEATVPRGETSPLGRAWTAVAQTVYGGAPQSDWPEAPQADLLVTALEALALSGAASLRLEGRS
ncbi:MAG: prenyltransferase/squalene oxidase repeat-containing protein [Bryobacteraceae bacterium]|nr:prenyltransferase/squalene oxidase repeat-containing protein [Bryobacteraceae bacterium]